MSVRGQWMRTGVGTQTSSPRNLTLASTDVVAYPTAMKRFLSLTFLCLLPSLVCCQSKPGDAAAAAPSAEEVAALPKKAVIETSLGKIVIELNGEKAPVTVKNFASYAKKKHYDGTIFHRVIDGFMIQGGGFAESDGKMVEKPTDAPIRNEGQNGLKNVRGSIAMARTPVLDSATSQFFINLKDNGSLDYPSNGGYAVFGKVTEGMDVVDQIRQVKTGIETLTMLDPSGNRIPAPSEDVPVEPVVIKSITVE